MTDEEILVSEGFLKQEEHSNPEIFMKSRGNGQVTATVVHTIDDDPHTAWRCTIYLKGREIGSAKSPFMQTAVVAAKAQARDTINSAALFVDELDGVVKR